MSTGISVPKGVAGLAEWMRRITLRSENKHLYFSSTTVNSSAGVMSTLHTMNLPLNPNGYFWRGVGQSVKVTSRGTFAANANTKKLTISCGLAACPFSAAINGGSFYSECEFWKPDVSTISARGVLWSTSTSFPVLIAGLGYAAAGTRIGEGVEVKSEGGDVAANDVVETFFRVEVLPSIDQY